MAAMRPLIVECPACGDPIEIPLALTIAEPDGNTVPVTLNPDLTPITAHAAQHREG